MKYTIESIADALKVDAAIVLPGCEISGVTIDHRKVTDKSTLFVALKGQKVDGHVFIPELLDMGVHNFLISDERILKEHKDQANFLLVNNVVNALQSVATQHRMKFSLPVIGITGSNGKTVVKEWLNTLLESTFRICRSPKSFNSQIGVPLSVLKLGTEHTLALFEAGISKQGEMPKLREVIKPTIGLMTNLGDAHDAGFDSRDKKLFEKLSLFKDCEKVICCKDHLWFVNNQDKLSLPVFTWSQSDKASDVYVKGVSSNAGASHLELIYKGQDYLIELPFEDRASIENSIHCFCLIAILDKVTPDVLDRFKRLSPVAMRMEIKMGVENSMIIDDSYNSDIGSLAAALDQLNSMKASGRMVILSDLDPDNNHKSVYAEIVKHVNRAIVDEVVLIGKHISMHVAQFNASTVNKFDSVDGFFDSLSLKTLRDKAILIKGARLFKFERLVKHMQAKQHQTRLEIDLQKLTSNLRYYRSILEPDTAIMVMVKAFAYGSGSFEIARVLQQERVDYLAVAYTDEGVVLRERGIRIPIMVMSPNKAEYEKIIRNNLEPEIFSIRALQDFVEVAKANRHLFDILKIHLKVDSGMHRLGIDENDVPRILEVLQDEEYIRLSSVFTHLAAADDDAHDEFTKNQVTKFSKVADELALKVSAPFMRHVLNSSGALRFPDYQFDMVRLGIGLYGFGNAHHDRHLLALGALKSYILQIKHIPAGESIGYSRAGRFDEDRTIATVAVGYADGLDRKLGNGKWGLRWNNRSCPIVGNVCMDMCMVDVTGLKAKEGDEIIVFDGAADIRKMAEIVGTIPYEILTNLSDRVSRVYLKE